jgi:DNA polymerase-3 subunit alpha
MLSRELMERLQGLLGGFPGLDRVELRVESSSSPTMRLELPVRVEARNMSLYAGVADMIGIGRALLANAHWADEAFAGI